MSERKSLLPNRDDPVFPLTDRSTPVLDRLRNGSGENKTAKKLGKKVGKLSLSEDEEERSEEMMKAMESFRSGLASELGVPEDAIEDSVVEEFGAIFAGLKEEDIVVEEVIEMKQDNLPVENEEENESSDEEDSVDFSSE